MKNLARMTLPGGIELVIVSLLTCRFLGGSSRSVGLPFVASLFGGRVLSGCDPRRHSCFPGLELFKGESERAEMS